MNDKYILSTNELENAIDYLDKAAYYFNNRDDKYWFKWLMISLHGALYGFGVCAVKGIVPERVLEMRLGTKRFEQKRKEIIDFYRNDLRFDLEGNEKILDRTVEYNLSQLLSIHEILEKCQDESIMKQKLSSKTLKITDLQQEAINRMVSYRNDFAHFKPKDISVITASEGWIVKEVVGVIKFLALESCNIPYNNNYSLQKVVRILEKFDL
ncbi:hypothetical protein [Mesobacillus foraminis]|uniref:hypothetical protein n=1 Tax=Mesobacillus foraminis TaxID=279826 RepID=UPI00104AC6C9|nr:hypothetical protein [Mesobacillus foraminis]